MQHADSTRFDLKTLPGPRGRLWSTWRLMTRPYETYAEWQIRFGKTFLVKALNGNVVVTSNTENIRRILAAKHDQITQFAVGTVEPLIGRSSVIMVSGQQHKRVRGMLTPPFRGEALRASAATMQTVADRVTKDLRPGQHIKVMDLSLDFSLEVIIQVVFGVQEGQRVQQFKSAIKDYVKSFLPVFAFSKLLQRGWVPQWKRFLNQKQKFDRLMDEQIRRYQDSHDESGSIVSLLMAERDEQGQPLSSQDLKDQLITLLFAGHETTQIAIAWAMSWLHRHPHILNDLLDQITGEGDLETALQSELMHGVCLESLRLNPVVADFLRVFVEPIELEEVSLPAPASLGVLTSNVHRDPEIYPRPEKFDPLRWSRQTIKPYEFLAFGGGVRRCLGENMALMEMKICLATWLRKFKFKLPAQIPDVERVHRRNLTMAPKSGIQLIVESVR